MLRWVRMSRYCELSGDTPDGFDRPPRTYGMKRLWAQEKAG